jgi:hypothetical protein
MASPAFPNGCGSKARYGQRGDRGIESLLKGEDYVHLDDALQDEGFRLAPEFLKQVKIAGIRTAAASGSSWGTGTDPFCYRCWTANLR